MYIVYVHLYTCTAIIVIIDNCYYYFSNCNLIFIDTITNSTSSEINLETEGEKEELQMFCDEAVNWIRLGDVLLDVCMSQHKKEMEDTKKQEEEKEEVERKQIEEQEMKKMEEQEMERMKEQKENDNDEEEDGTTQVLMVIIIINVHF